MSFGIIKEGGMNMETNVNETASRVNVQNNPSETINAAAAQAQQSAQQPVQAQPQPAAQPQANPAQSAPVAQPQQAAQPMQG